MLTFSLKRFAEAFSDDFKVNIEKEKPVDLEAMASSFAERVINIFKLNQTGVRPVFGAEFPFATDPHWSNNLLFYEYYHGETGKGLGASHQTGWSGLVANFIDEFRGD